MAENGDNLILHLLREIRSVQDQHSATFADHDARFDRLQKKIEDWQETIATGIGFAAHANMRNESLQKEIVDLKRPIDRLEQAH